MKTIHIIVLLLAVLLTLPVMAKKKKDGGNPLIKFTEQTYNFGNVKEQGGPVSHEFEFFNTGNGNLVILDATAQCGCTRPEYPKNPVAPGKKGKVKITYNPVGRPGPFRKTVTLKTNAKPRKVTLVIEGTVVPNK